MLFPFELKLYSNSLRTQNFPICTALLVLTKACATYMVWATIKSLSPFPVYTNKTVEDTRLWHRIKTLSPCVNSEVLKIDYYISKLNSSH